MASLVEKLEECLAAAYAAALTGEPVRNIIARGKVLGTAPPLLSELMDLLVTYHAGGIAVPYFEMRVALARNPGLAAKIERIVPLFLHWAMTEELVPQIKVGEGIGQARKLVRWAAVAIRDGDQDMLRQLAPKLQTARWHTRDHQSGVVVECARKCAAGELTGYMGAFAYMIRGSLGTVVRQNASDKLAALLRAAIAVEAIADEAIAQTQDPRPR